MGIVAFDSATRRATACSSFVGSTTSTEPFADSVRAVSGADELDAPENNVPVPGLDQEARRD